MIEVIGGNLFQWDTGRVIRINTDTNIHEVHFTTKDMTYAYVVSTYEKDGAVYCEIPNILLQQEKSLICYEVTKTDGGEMTVAEKTLALHKRNKPQDYVYTEDELKNFDRLAALIPTKLSQLTDDIGAGGAKITSVNGVLPDENGNVEVETVSESELNIAINTALAQAKESGQFDGADGKDGKDGKDGTSATHSWNGTVLTITSASGTSSADLKGEKGEKGERGEKGETGANGANGANGQDGVSCTHSWNGTVLTVTSASGTSSANLKGEKGETGANGTNGYTPVKGTDYFTDSDKQELVADVLAALPIWNGGSY